MLNLSKAFVCWSDDYSMLTFIQKISTYSPVSNCGGVNPIQDGLFFFCSLIGEGQKAPPPLPQNISHKSCNDKTWHSYALPTEDPKNI